MVYSTVYTVQYSLQFNVQFIIQYNIDYFIVIGILTRGRERGVPLEKSPLPQPKGRLGTVYCTVVYFAAYSTVYIAVYSTQYIVVFSTA